MTDPLEPYLKFSKADRHVGGNLTEYRNFYTENPDGNYIKLTIARSKEQQEPKPCYFYWSPNTDEGFRVFRDRPGEMVEEVELRSNCSLPGTQQSGSPHLWYLGAEDKSVSWDIPLGERISRAIEKDEWIIYDLFWPGGEVYLWDWGSKDTKKERLESAELKPKSTPIILPGGARCRFCLIEGSPPPPPPRPLTPPILELDPSTLTPGVPIFSLEIEGPPTWRTQERWPLTWKLTYHGVSGDETPRPITFSDTGEWESWRGDGVCGYALFEDEDVPRAVGTSEGFMSLQPNETWSEKQELKIMLDLPEDARDGEVMRHRFKGCKLTWWDWGMKEDHMDTIVMVVGFGVITKPADNDGRPEVVVPASNMVEFTVIEQERET
ncbi:hypothetical protein AnigIFM59636_010475 [Aspergillus niger]|nr:hypothetical protein CBS133816_7785 [Aspergillus niger]KAI2920366.1 hypothetical protein CBS147320_8132 [Aspergillus niger]KAI2970826.1 hypothetical protein CBS147324_5316 [Aspergillus niger]KAI2980855.1 hypothetical protein CBS147482_10347 [Aspergillus niger]GKZ96232.1 hypothetical protein AnigIFM59636_010475 [Aspergillus niger]